MLTESNYNRSKMLDTKTTAHRRIRSALPAGAVAILVIACLLKSWTGNRALAEPEIFRSRAPVQNSSPLPMGTILPVRLEKVISTRTSRVGDIVESRITQDVPLPDQGKISMKSLLKGSILSVVKDSEGTGAKVTLKFNQIEDRKEVLVVATSLRAIASYNAVRTAQIPLTGLDAGTPVGWGTTVQIGGDIRFGDGGKVRNHTKQIVGKAIRGGVLVHVRANPALGCEGPVDGDDHPQALWVFSADACGVYDLQNMRIVHSGRSEPLGEITLHFEKDDMALEPGTGMLLRVVTQP